MQTCDVFKQLVKEIATLLKVFGYSKKGNDFFKRSDSTWGLINIQKSQKSTSSEIIFTFNYGICSETVREFFEAQQTNKKPSLGDCQLQGRIGDFLPNRDDKWWSIQADSDIQTIVNELRTLLVEHIVPFIDNYNSDEKLKTLWQSGQSPGLTEARRVINLAVLVKKIGTQDELVAVLNQAELITRGQPIANLANTVKKRLLNNE